MTLQPEQEQVVKTISLGEYFKPFDGVQTRKTPQTDYTNIYKNGTFQIQDVGSLVTNLDYHSFDIQQRTSDEEVLVLLPDEEKVIKESDIQRLQEELETRLMDFGVGILEDDDIQTSDVFQPRVPNFQITLRTPSETTYNAKFNEYRSNTEWNNNEAKYSSILVPDISNVTNNIELKIDRVAAPKTS